MAKQKEAWDKLSMLEKALLIKLSVDNGVSSLKLIRDTYNLYSSGGKKQSAVNRPRDIDEAIEISRNTPYNKNIDDVEGPGYREYMWKLAQAKSKVWGISPEEAYDSFIHPSEFNYRRWYNLASQDELDNTLTNGDAHWMDVFGKTVGADTFSNESPYSGYVNPYNPKGITGGTWTGRLGIDEYIPSESQIDNNWPLNKAWFAIDRGNKYYQEKISKGEDTHEVPSIMTYNNGVMLPEITVTPRGNYIEYSPYANGGNLTHRKDYGGPTDYPEVTIKEEPWVDEYFKNNTNVAGMAIGEGMNGVNGDRRVIINPYNTQMNDSTSRASVLLNERLRHVMDQENFSLPNITKELIQKYDGTSYLGDTLNIGRTEAARYLSGDPSHNLTGSLKLYIDSLKLNYKKSGEELGESLELNYPNGVIRQGKQDILKKIVQSPVGAFTRFIDPTGILSIPDAYYDLKHLVETPTTQRTTADYIDATASVVGLFPFGNNISDFVKVKNWRQGLQLANKYVEHLPFKLVGVYPDMYLYNNQKSTGGPLYPFSFEKNPFLKTPVVRYDEGGPLNNWEQGALDRATKVYSNYELAKDNKIPSWRIPLQKKLKQLDLPSGLSNCTLTATQWVDPTNPIMSAATIFNNPKTGYVEIDNKDAIPGNLLITKNPETGGYHTMMIEGFTDSGEPILRYSNGNHTADALRTNISLSEYHSRDNSHGGNHTEDHYFRYNYPNEVFLPEITVFAKRGLK